MAVDKLDLKSIWENGQSYKDWLASSKEPPRVDEMGRIYKETALPDYILQGIKGLTRPVHVLALSEDWCGDVRRNIPVLAKICDQNPSLLRLRVVDKETKPQLMVRYLTNAAEAIPIFIFFNDAFVEVGHWGPRPAECKRIMARAKACNKVDDARQKIVEFYTQDQSQSAARELWALIDIAAAKEI